MNDRGDAVGSLPVGVFNGADGIAGPVQSPRGVK